MAGTRRKSRIIALQTLYEADCAGHDPQATLARSLEEKALSEESALFARELVSGVVESRQRIDDIIQTFAPAWPLEQMSPIDRNILRLAIFEILLNNSVPVKAAINEAVELAKSFGSDNSPKFVNGVLGSVSAWAKR